MSYDVYDDKKIICCLILINTFRSSCKNSVENLSSVESVALMFDYFCR